MNSSETPEKLTPEELQEEANAIFAAGEIMGCMFKLNVKALERFWLSSRSDPLKGSDFRYRQQVRAVIQCHKEMFKPE